MPYRDPRVKKLYNKKYGQSHRTEKLAYCRKYYREHSKIIRKQNSDYHKLHPTVSVKGKLYIVRIPRTGVCNLCRAVAKIDCSYTQFHHIAYDKTDLRKNILELCPKCHMKLDNRRKDPITGQFVTRELN